MTNFHFLRLRFASGTTGHENSQSSTATAPDLAARERTIELRQRLRVVLGRPPGLAVTPNSGDFVRLLVCRARVASGQDGSVSGGLKERSRPVR